MFSLCTHVVSYNVAKHTVSVSLYSFNLSCTPSVSLSFNHTLSVCTHMVSYNVSKHKFSFSLSLFLVLLQSLFLAVIHNLSFATQKRWFNEKIRSPQKECGYGTLCSNFNLIFSSSASLSFNTWLRIAANGHMGTRPRRRQWRGIAVSQNRAAIKRKIDNGGLNVSRHFRFLNIVNKSISHQSDLLLLIIFWLFAGIDTLSLLLKL